MGSREDDGWWDVKYSDVAECHEHGEMHYDEDAGDWRCSDCEENQEAYKRG